MEKLEFCKKWIKKLNSDYSVLDQNRAEALKFFEGDPEIVELVEGRSKIVTNDMQDAVDLALPDILESITGTDEPLKLEPTGSEDVDSVKKLQILGNIMLKRRNPWFRRCNDFVQDSMRLKFGIFKYQWIEDEKKILKDYEGLTPNELGSLLQKPGAKLIEDKLVDDKKNPKTQKRVTRISYSQMNEYVRIDTVPSELIKFPLDTRDFDNPAFVVEEVQYYRHEFIQAYGKKKFLEIEDEKEAIVNGNLVNNGTDRYKDLGGLSFIYDNKSQKYKSYECYFWEEDKDVPWIFVFAGETILLDEENKYGKPPYRGGSPFLLAHRLIGRDYFDLLKEIHKQRTYLIRQIFDNVTQTNFRRYFGDSDRLNIDDYLNNNATNALIRTLGDPHTVVMGEDKAPLPPELLEFWEMMNVEKDYHIPTPRSFGGINPKVLNKTYRGQAQQVNQASKKLLMMIRSYMEDVFGPLFNDILDCIIKFMKKSTSIRYLNENYDITPDNIIGRYDLVVNVGLGAQDKSDTIAKLQQLIGLMQQQFSAGSGVITAANMKYAMSELVKAMGFLNTTDFVTDPEVKILVMDLIQGVQMLIQNLPQTSEIPELTKSFQSIILPLMQALGMQKEMEAITNPQGGENSAGTFPGQQTPDIPVQPDQPMVPRETVDGGGFYA